MAQTTTTKPVKTQKPESPIITGREWLLVWEKIKGMWKYRKPDPIKELAKMRKEWERRLPLLK